MAETAADTKPESSDHVVPKNVDDAVSARLALGSSPEENKSTPKSRPKKKARARSAGDDIPIDTPREKDPAPDPDEDLENEDLEDDLDEDEDDLDEDEDEDEDEDSSETGPNSDHAIKTAALIELQDFDLLEKHLHLPKGSFSRNSIFYKARQLNRDLETERDQFETEKKEYKSSLGEKERKLTARYGAPALMLDRAAKGDLGAYMDVIKRTTKLDPVRVLEAYKAGRRQYDMEATSKTREVELQRRIDALEKRLGEDKPEPKDDKRESDEDDEDDENKKVAQIATARRRTDKYLAKYLKGTGVEDISGWKDLAFDVYKENYDRSRKVSRLSPEETAREIKRRARQRLESQRWLLDDDDKPRSRHSKKKKKKTGKSRGRSSADRRGSVARIQPKSLDEAVNRALGRD